MPTPRSPLILPLALLACTDRPLGGTETGTTIAGTTEAPPATTLDPTTTAPPVTTGTASTAVDPSDTTAAPKFDLPAQKFDLPAPHPTDGLFGCTLDAPAGTAVSGPSELGPFAAQRAYFGYVATSDPYTPLILFVSPDADPAVELANPQGLGGPVLHSQVSTDPFLEGGWIGTWPTSATLYSDNMIGYPQRPDTVTIAELAGNWDVFDPADPPRLVGALEGAIAGPFDAVYCDKLNWIIIPE